MAVVPPGRIRIGVTGLALVFLLVAVGASLTDDTAVADGGAFANGMEEAPPSEPLSELGAAPGQAAEPAQEPVEQIPVPIDPETEELIVNEIAGPLGE